MLRKLFNILIFCVLLMVASNFVTNAQKITDPVLASYVRATDDIRTKMPVEKLYLQLDKSDYILGDTLHFKSYLLNGDYLDASKRSGLLYVELDNVNNKPIKRIVTPIKMGITWGDIPLDEKEISDGNYTLRAYTNWMQNFGNNYVFTKNITVARSNYDQTTLVSTVFKLDTAGGHSRVVGKLKFLNYTSPIALTDMKLEFRNGVHRLNSERMTTGIDGGIDFSITLKGTTVPDNLNIVARYRGRKSDTTQLSIPVLLNRPEKTDLQFLPEGGSLVAEIPAKVAFKALSEDGKGTDVSGEIDDAAGNAIANFKTLHSGMGSFSFIPKTGERYYGKIRLPNGETKRYPLPGIDTLGTTLSVINKGNDSLVITVNGTSYLRNNRFYLLAQSRNIVCYATTVAFSNAPFTQTVAKALFPTGITRFTLLNALNQPLNERLFFVNHNDNLNIRVVTDKPVYASRDSVSLMVKVTDSSNNPVSGNFSVAVTDDDQVKTNPLTNNLINTMLFTSDLKGEVENPGYYFEASSPERLDALDNLMLTQGWVGYSWKDAFNIKNIETKFRAEEEYAVRGKVTNLFNKPIPKTEVVLMRKSPFLVIDTLTDDKGEFNFNNERLLSADSAFFLVEAKNKKGRNFNVGIDVEEFLPPDFTGTASKYMPWYVNSDSTIINKSQLRKAQNSAEGAFTGTGKQLKEVEIKSIKTIPGSQNPSPGANDIIWDQKDMDNAKNSTLFEILDHRYHIFKRGRFNNPIYYMNTTYILYLFVDGHLARPTIDYLEYLTAKDIAGIEVVLFMNPFKAMADIGKVYVTTHSNNGLFIKHTPGVYTFKPIPLSTPKEFYSPKYTSVTKNVAPGTDLRSTIYWEPNLFTDKDGYGTISFFTADKPATYTAIIEGTDLNGNLGSQRYTINAKPKQTP